MLSCLTNLLNIKEISFPHRASSNSSFSRFFFVFSSLTFFFCLLQRCSNPQVTQASPTVHLKISLSPVRLHHSLIFSSNEEAPDIFTSSRGLPTGLLPWNIPSSAFFDTLELSVQTIRSRPCNLLNLIYFTTLGTFNNS